jgi:hypothetical protein
MTHQLKLIGVLLLSLSVWQCTEDEEITQHPQKPTPTTVINFALEHQELPVSSALQKIDLTLSQAVKSPGSVAVRLSGDAEYGLHYSTLPNAQDEVVTLFIEKGQTTLSFTLIPAGSQQPDTNKPIFLTLENPSAGFSVGGKATSTLELIVKDKEPTPAPDTATVAFQEDTLRVSENSHEGIAVWMQMQGSLSRTERVTVSVIPEKGFEYATDFLIDHLPVLNSLNFDFIPDHQGVSFRVIPVDDRLRSGSFNVTFVIASATDGLKIGERDTLVVTIEEDDIVNPELMHSIADLRSKFDTHSGAWYLPDDYYIEGIITSGNNVASDKVVYIQDSTAGIMLVMSLPPKFQMGDKVQINLKGAEGEIVNDQRALWGVADWLGITLERGLVVAPEVITLEQLATGNYESKRVQIRNISFPEADGQRTWQGRHRMTDGQQFWTVGAHAAADFSQKPLPKGTYTVTGIVGSWHSLLPQTYAEDVTVAL